MAAALSCLIRPCLATDKPDTVLCPLSEYIDDNDETVREFFECPGMEDPPNHRMCCDEKCCPLVDSVLQVMIKILTMQVKKNHPTARLIDLS